MYIICKIQTQTEDSNAECLFISFNTRDTDTVTEYQMQIFGGVPFIKPQNDT